MSLQDFVKLLEGEPGCGSTFPGFSRGGEGPSAPARSAPVPFQTRLLISTAMDAARLYQLGQRVGGEIQGSLFDAANYLFKRVGADQHPPAELYQLMLANWPPPPPNYTVRLVESLAMQYAVEALLAGGPHVPTGRKQTIVEVLFGKLLHYQDGGNTTSGPHTNLVPIHIGPSPRFIEVTEITETRR